eukprot:2634116-Prymnesium_polylepis.2
MSRNAAASRSGSDCRVAGRVRRRLALPHWARKKPKAFSFLREDQFEIRIKSDKIGAPEVPTPKELMRKVSRGAKKLIDDGVGLPA